MQLEAPNFQFRRREAGGLLVELSVDLGVDIETVVGGSRIFLQQKIAEWMIKKVFELLCKKFILNPAFSNSPTIRNILCGKQLMKQQRKMNLKLNKWRTEKRIQIINPLTTRTRRVVTTRTGSVSWSALLD